MVARKRLFPSVNPLHMTKQSHFCLTPLPSSRVISVPAVHLERRILCKLGLTVGALERPQARVRPLMQNQGGFGAEGLSAVGADNF